MDTDRLIEEITADPLNRGYSAMDDSALWASLSTKDRAKLRILNSRQLLEWSAENGRYMKLENAAANVALGDGMRSVVKAAIKLLDRPDTELDLSVPSHASMMGALVLSGVFSSDDQASLEQLATVNISRAEEIGCSDLTQEMLTYTRKLINLPPIEDLL